MFRTYVARLARSSAPFICSLGLSGSAVAQNISTAVAHWPFDDGTNPTHDVVGGYDGTLHGPAFTSVVAPMPGCGQALSFDGQSTVSVASVPALSFSANQNMSIALWFRETGGQSVYHILGKRLGCNANSIGINYQIARDPTNGLEFNAETGGIVATHYQPLQNMWTHIVVVYASGLLFVYVNGAHVATNPSYTLDGANNADLLIGGSGSCGGDFIGEIDEVWISNQPLTPSEVQFLASQNPSTYCSPKTNSVGCVPAIGWAGAASLSGPDNFYITARHVLNNKSGVMFWGIATANVPFFGGTRCVASPFLRTAIQNSGGNPPPNDCSGSYSFHFSQSYMSAHALAAGSSVCTQYWSRDPGFAVPNNVGLTDGLLFVVCP
jgi:hypothetical protein